MTQLDDKLVPKTLELINKFGKNLTFVEVISGGVYDPATGGESDPVTVNHIRKAIPPSDFRQRFADDEIHVGILQTGVAASGLPFSLVLGMKVLFDDGEFNVIRFNPVYSGNDKALFMILLRGIDDEN